MAARCPECGSASAQKVEPARVAAGRMVDPAFRAMLALNSTDAGAMGRATRPNAPDRKCDSCGAEFRARPTRCPGCGSPRLARVVYMRRRDWREPRDAAPGLASLARDAGIGPDDGGEVIGELVRLMESKKEADAGWGALQAELGFVSKPHSGAINRPTLECGECSRGFRPRPVRCPGCGSSDIARIQYGLPLPGRQDTGDGPVVQGGCSVSPDMPSMACQSCYCSFGSVRL